MALSGLIVESNGLCENKLEYLLTSLKAKQSWVPFTNKLASKQLYQDINLGKIEIKLGGAMKKSDGQGSYLGFNFKFSDLTLKTLANQIELAEKKQAFEEAVDADLAKQAAEQPPPEEGEEPVEKPPVERPEFNEAEFKAEFDIANPEIHIPAEV